VQRDGCAGDGRIDISCNLGAVGGIDVERRHGNEAVVLLAALIDRSGGVRL
jgi:hypothetical protein